MTYTIRVTGPNIDHVSLITSFEDIEAARAVLDKIEREGFPPTYYEPDKQSIGSTCVHCGQHVSNHAFGGMCPTPIKA